MNKKIIVIPIVGIVIIFFIGISFDDEISKTNEIIETETVFHITLANPELYVDGVYTELFTIEKGEYFFRFVPNGSSPKVLSIAINGESFNFSEDFILQSTLHQTGISEYFTWEYDGEKNFEISEMQEITIIVNPNGNVMGSVSVDILEN